MNNATSTICTIHTVDGRADGHTGAFQYNLSYTTDNAKTGNFFPVFETLGWW